MVLFPDVKNDILARKTEPIPDDFDVKNHDILVKIS